MGGKIHFRITEDLKESLKKAKLIFFFLDYDGTLVPIRKKPGLAKISVKTRRLLKTLAEKKWAKVFIVTGRTLKNIKYLIGLKSISYIGNHGFELTCPALTLIDFKIDSRFRRNDKGKSSLRKQGSNLTFSSKKAEDSGKAVRAIYRKLKKSLNIKDAIIENKFYTLSIHYRLVKKRYLEILKCRAYNIAAPYRKKGVILITEGKKVLEIRPNLRWNKGSMVRWIIKKLRIRGGLPVYIGDDKTDEDAFKALKESGLTILVSKRPVPTEAKFRLKSPGEVFAFLMRVINLKNVK